MTHHNCKWALVLLGLLFLAAGCGSGLSRSGTTATLPTAGPSTPTGSTSSTVSSPIIVQVGAGQSADGVNITVPAPSSTTPPNAQLLGVIQGTSGSAFNTGQIIHRGQSATVIVFGPGLDANTTVSIGGPTDIAVSNVRAIKSQSGSTGIAFDAVVGGNAAFGGRTVFLRNAQSDISAFTGGLEVVQ